MDAKNIRVALPTMMGLITGVVSALSVYFAMESEVLLIKHENATMNEKISKIEKRMDTKFIDLEENDAELLKAFNDCKIEIIKAIHEHEHK